MVPGSAAKLALVCAAAASECAAAGQLENRSLYERLGGELKLRRLVSDVYEDHASDPLSASFFGPHAFALNTGDADLVKERVFQFFSSGIGGPHKYEGRSMAEVHRHMRIDEQAFHAVAYHVLKQMQRHGLGGRAEREEVLAILMSLKPEVQAGSASEQAEPPAGLLDADGEGQASLDVLQVLHGFLTVSLPSCLAALPVPRSTRDLRNLSLDDWYALLPLILLLLSPAILVQALRKIAQAHDLEHNSSGLFQFSRLFYSGRGPLCALPFLLGYSTSALALLGAAWAGRWSWAVFVAGFVLLPIADLFIGEDSYNPTPEEEQALKRNVWFRVVTWLYTPSYAATILYGAHVISSRPELTAWELAGITSGVGIAGGFGIGCVHEVIHRPHAFDLAGGVLALVLANYSHFWIEHLWGHHRHVATDLDPASSALGDDVYTFVLRDIVKSFVEAWGIEKRFQAERGRGWLHNRIVQGYAASAAVAGLIYAHFGTRALAFYLVQGLFVAWLIENTNYIEHYGLRRRPDGKGGYERPGWFHAWDTADRLTNWMLFKIQRHPDHHTNAGRPYQILRTLPQSPTLPTGYAGMILLSWFPPAFFAVMDPLVAAAYAQRDRMEAKGVLASAFPRGANNVSSFFKVEGGDFFEAAEVRKED